MKTICKKIMIALVLGGISAHVAGQNFQWVQTGIGSGMTYRNQVVQDSYGFLYACGMISDSMVFGSSVLNSPGFFAAKYDSQGNLIWLQEATFLNGSAGTITIDNNNNIFIATPCSNVQFGSYFFSGPGTLLAQLDTGGTIVWAKMTAALTDVRLTHDQAGSIYLYGEITNTISLEKFDGSGNLTWQKSAGGAIPTQVSPGGITTDQANNILISGSVEGNVMFSSTPVNIPAANGTDAFAAKYDASGNVIWVLTGFGSDYDNGTSITTDLNNNIYLAGYSNSTTSNILNSFFAKYDTNGNWQWTQLIQGAAAYAIKTDNNNIYLSGNSMFNDTTIFDTDTLTNFPLYRLLFLAKYSLTGNFEWVKAAFSQGQGGFCCEDPDDFVIDDLSNSIYIAGNFSYSAIFDAININTSPGLHGYNFFLAKLQGGVTGIPDVTDPLVNFQLFPNPTSGSVRLIFDAKEKNRLQCEIRNVLGEKVFEKVLTSSDSRNAFDLDISFLPKGIYIIRVSDGVIYENRKLVVE